MAENIPRQWTVLGPSPPHGSIEADLDQEMHKFMVDNNVRNAQLAIGKNGKVLTSRSYSWSWGEHVTEDADTFLLASVSKAFCCAAIYELFPDENVRKATKAADVLGWGSSSVDKGYDQMTVQQLVDHTAGFGYDETSPSPNEWTYLARKAAAHLQRDVTTPEDLVDYVRTIPLAYEPFDSEKHDMWKYSNIGYVVLSMIVAKKSNKPYFDFLLQDVLAKNGLGSMNLYTVDTRPSEYGYDFIRAPPYSYDEGLPSYDYKEQTKTVPAVYGGDAAWFCGLNMHAGYGRTGSTWGASTFIWNRRDGRDLAILMNTRESEKGGFRFDAEDSQGNGIGAVNRPQGLFNFEGSPIHHVMERHPQ
ncbi:hypothetical protein LTR64_007883 [Lithohypha guttulata]|uniref:uncharacterized protein n=1 Tax=Lithohypha guttulata TaxID=1690604 RepID=UPI002DDFD767|nr:hypothetical protein LTR51_008250 [Lithohypha guttulata]